ncbi:hypothetical protein LSM04_004163 [Trypanosoma melophagium]|uniref:uncharacterized protein n=1 Tax=Trypanosoma melophagium TaxID=715481 RepID=UPI00351A541B|nr:hypothetical protein LSM04_004163 [Trypanosoma melophagium]
MGCQHSGLVREGDRVFGVNGLHVGRHGDVDLTARSMDVFGPKFIELIRRDGFHTARRLHLSENKLYTLGKEMTRVPEIEELYINANRFERLPGVLGEMPNLRLLNASMNPLGHQTRPLDVLPRIPSLATLILRDCSLTSVPRQLLNCAHLQELDLSDNVHLKLTGVQFGLLAELRRLLIANCGIMGELPAGVKDISTLEALDISANFFDFDDPAFFGKKLPATLTELHLRGMQLKAVPPVIVSLRKLSYLDLAENPIETLDVLAGRLVRKLPTRSGVNNGQSNNVGNSVTDVNDDVTSVASHGSTRGSMGQVSRAGCIAFVPQPIPLTKLSLRACDLRTLPKYFHKLTNLVDIDLSENENLDDPNMTLFSFSNLQVLNIVGCPFAENIRNARNEWFDIAKLRNLHTINWEVWKGVRNMSPYRTKVPLEITGLRLRQINGIALRPGLFVGDTVQTTVNLLLDGYFKVDLALDNDLVYSYAEAVHALQPLESFFFSEKNKNRSVRGDEGKFIKNKKINNIKNMCCNSMKSELHVNSDVLQIVINRYIFFLTMQAANYNVIIIPPADVMAVHYAQMTLDPLGYRSDCEAICGQILSCNYRLFFIEQKMRPHGVKEALVESRRVWNMMVRTAQKDLKWLRYDFWERRAKRRVGHEDTATSIKDDTNLADSPVPDANVIGGIAAPTTSTGSAIITSITKGTADGKLVDVLGNVNNGTTTSLGDAIPANNSSSNIAATATANAAGVGVSTAPAAPPSDGLDTSGLQQMNSNGDLRSVLDLSITAHFIEQGPDRFVQSLRGFFHVNNHFLDHEMKLRELNMDWTRYVKYLALYAYIQRLKRPEQLEEVLVQTTNEVENNSLVAPDAYLPRPSSPESLAPLAPRRTGSVLSRFANSTQNTAGNTGAGGGGGGPTAGSVPYGGGQSYGGTTRRGSLLIRNGENSGRRRGAVMPTSNPVPTIGITLLLYTHRTAHAKYYQTLMLLGLENIDVSWENTVESVDATMKSWEMLYSEMYVEKSNTAFIMFDGMDFQKSQEEAMRQQSTTSIGDRSVDTSHRSTAGSIRRTGSRRSLRHNRQVTLCCADTEYGIF